MDPELKKLLDALAKSQSQLTETITARFAPADPAAREAEKKALAKEILEMLSVAGFRPAPAERKMKWGTQDTKPEEGVETLSFGRFLKAVNDKDLATLKAANGQSETSADGGYAVPVEYANELIKLERTNGLVRAIARTFPMGSATRKVPRELSSPTVYVVGEGTEPAALSKGTLTQLTQTAKKFMAIVPFTDELLEDNSIGMDSFIAERVAAAMGQKEDQLALVGDVSGSSDAFNGIFFTAGVNNVSLDGADLSYVDVVNMLMAPNAAYRGRLQWMLSTTALTKMMLLVDDNNRPIWTMPDAGNPGRILGKPYFESDQIPDTLGTTRTNGDKTAAFIGAWDALWISPRGGYTVKASDSASDSTGKNAFSQDETWFKFRRRESIDVANPEAFAKLAIPA